MDPKNYHEMIYNAECLYTWPQLEKALDRMAQEITVSHKNSNPVILSVMVGALITTGHLLTRLHFPLEVDYVHATRYGSATEGGELKWLVEPRVALHGRHVIIVDDIMDGGVTLSAIIAYCRDKGAVSVKTAVMVNKKRQRDADLMIEPDYIGVETEDRYLFGFGLDYEGQLRNVPGIYAIR
jgi:hypoxanthine phosphoribosyltransferase